MLELVPQSLFSWNFDIRENGGPVAHISSSFWRERGEISIDGAGYRLYRQGVVSGDFVLEHAGQSLARAQKPSAFLNSFRVEYAGKGYTLKKRSLLGRSFVLLDNDREVGSIQTTGFLTRGATVSLPEEMPLPVKVFVIWLVILMWRRAAKSSSGTG